MTEEKSPVAREYSRRCGLFDTSEAADLQQYKYVTIMQVLEMSCWHCCAPREDHASNGRCLFDVTEYEPMGYDRADELIRRRFGMGSAYVFNP